MPVELEAKVCITDVELVRSRLGSIELQHLGSRLERNVYLDTAERTLLSRDEGLRIRSAWPNDAAKSGSETSGIAIEPSSISNIVSATRTRSPEGCSAPQCIITFKGPQQGEDLKQREEIEFTVGEAEAAMAMLARLGYRANRGFEKRRESWLHLSTGCQIDLDELPQLGWFLEIEGDSRELIATVLRELHLQNEPLITTSYIAMYAAAAPGEIICF